jgi:hypothetical protein
MRKDEAKRNKRARKSLHFHEFFLAVREMQNAHAAERNTYCTSISHMMLFLCILSGWPIGLRPV